MDSGTRLGHYEILEPLGVGGMGEVYRARDTKLDRHVAIKVLPDDFAADVERLARFEREAKLLAQLNHPNIATIHGFGDADGIRFIAMECIEGETLADRLAGSGRLEVGEALAIAGQIAEALEAAHDKGVIHRDLKPANVKVTREWKVKVLDFGLAKAYDSDGSASGFAADLSGSPTVLAATGTGVIMGTAAYMSPEQARAGTLDKRTDIWSFGCVLFELLTASSPFGGPTVSDTLASILKEEPDWDLLPATLPGQIHRLLRRCLQKAPGERLHDIADARIEIREAIENPEGDWRGSGHGTPRWQVALPWLVAAAMAAWAILTPNPPPPVPTSVDTVTRFEIPAKVASDVALAYSDDGSRLVYAGVGADGIDRLYTRQMGEFNVEPIEGSEGGMFPFFSPDGQWIGYWSDSALVKVSVAGGPPFPIAGSRGARRGADWGDGGRIVLQRGFGTGLVTISAEGGDARPLTRVDPARAERQHMAPAFLPGGMAVVFTIMSGINSERSDIAVVALDDGETRVLTEGRHPVYVSTGHLTFMRRGALMGVVFDPVTLEIVGDPVVLVADVRIDVGRTYESNGSGVYAVSESGALAYMPAVESATPDKELVWVDRAGNVEVIATEPGRYATPRLSPDGRQLAVSILEDSGFGVWTYDLDRDTFARVTRGGSNGYAQWSPDGSQLTFSSDRAGPVNVFRQSVTVQGEAERLATHHDTTLAGSWSPDGLDLLVTVIGPDTLGDIAVITGGPDGSLQMLLETDADEYAPEFSPDGTWFAYSVSEGDDSGVYVQSYPDLQTKKLVGATRGINGQPMWSPDGRELFYRSGTQMMVASIALGPDIAIGRPRALFDLAEILPGNLDAGSLEGIRGYDVSADGKRFLMVRPVRDTSAPVGPETIRVVLNWSEELKRLVPVTR